jgi:hypothetical protein
MEYYANETHMENDRKTEQKLARYLAKFYEGKIGSNSQMAIVDHVRGFIPSKVYFSLDGRDSVRVYETGPRSCMGGKEAGDFASYPHHPCEVYDPTKGDLCVAYIKSGERITGRVVVWKDKKIFGRPYGDTTRLKRALESLGYVCNSSKFVGALLPYIPAGNGFVFPYFDGMEYVSVLSNQKQVVLHNRYGGLDVPNMTLWETHSADSQSGVTPEYEDEEYNSYCECCEEYGPEDYTRYIEGYGTTCDGCVDHYFSTCDECDNLSHVDDTIQSDAGDTYCSSSCYRENFEECGSCKNETDVDCLTEIDYGDMLCEDCWGICEDCKTKVNRDFLDGNDICEDCNEDKEDK